MAHPRLDEMLARMRAARQVGAANEASPEQLQRLRELARDCPAFTPNLLELARLLRLTDEPEVTSDEALAEIQRLLEQAVQASGRSSQALLELAHFTYVFRNESEAAEKLFEESVNKALHALEESWAGLLDFWSTEGSKPQLKKALRLAEGAEKLFPESPRLMNIVDEARQKAARMGLIQPDES